MPPYPFIPSGSFISACHFTPCPLIQVYPSIRHCPRILVFAFILYNHAVLPCPSIPQTLFFHPILLSTQPVYSRYAYIPPIPFIPPCRFYSIHLVIPPYTSIRSCLFVPPCFSIPFCPFIMSYTFIKTYVLIFHLTRLFYLLFFIQTCVLIPVYLAQPVYYRLPVYSTLLTDSSLLFYSNQLHPAIFMLTYPFIRNSLFIPA